MYTAQVSVGSTATLLHSGGSVPRIVLVKNPTGGTTFYIGGDAVTTVNGFELAAGESVRVSVGSGGLYGRTAAGSQTAFVIEG